MTSTLCPLSPSGLHRVYYSARVRPLGLMRECRDCSQTIAFIAGVWTVPPPGEILVGLMAEFQARMIEGDPDGIQNPRGIFGAAGEPRPMIFGRPVIESPGFIDDDVPLRFGRLGHFPIDPPKIVS